VDKKLIILKLKVITCQTGNIELDLIEEKWCIKKEAICRLIVTAQVVGFTVDIHAIKRSSRSAGACAACVAKIGRRTRAGLNPDSTGKPWNFAQRRRLRRV